NPAVDVLTANLLGRGVWTLYDVTSYFLTATVLRYGLADNDSSPDRSFLTDRPDPSDSRKTISRDLEKVGTGTLTISGDSSYTGSTTVLGGTLLANASLVSSNGGLTVGSAGTVRGVGTLPNTVLSGILYPGNNRLRTLPLH